MKASCVNLIVCLTTMNWLATSSVLQAQVKANGNPDTALINDVSESTVAMHPVTPFLESSSVLLAKINLEAIDVNAILPLFSGISDATGLEAQSEMIRGFIDSMRGGGVSSVYVSAATRTPLDGGPLVIIPCQNPAVVNGLATVLVQNAPDPQSQKIHVGDEVVVVGPAVALDRVLARSGADRPDLILPLDEPDLLDHQLVFALPDELRQELTAFWPQTLSVSPLPDPISPRQIAEDVLRVVIGLRLVPSEDEVRLRIETTGTDGADRVKELFDRLLMSADDLSQVIQVEVDDDRVELRAQPDALARLTFTMLAPARDAARSQAKMNSIKQIGLAFHNYHAAEKHFPPRVMTDSQGKPLMSWRVAILPHLDNAALYQAMKLDQPWNSDANREVSSTVVPVYCEGEDQGNKTTLRAPVFPGSLWDGDGPPKSIREIRDGTSNTIAIIDAPPSAAVEWADPQPWVISADDPMSDIFGERETVTVGFLDGSARVLHRDEMSNDQLKSLLTVAAGDVP